MVEFGSFPHSDMSDFNEKLIIRAEHIPHDLYEVVGRSRDNISISRHRKQHNIMTMSFTGALRMHSIDQLVCHVRKSQIDALRDFGPHHTQHGQFIPLSPPSIGLSSNFRNDLLVHRGTYKASSVMPRRF